MPYNTRRKSLSLPSLGIQLPQGSRAQQQSPPATSKSEPPQKKIKREHSPLVAVNQTGRYDPTPPPSPPPENKANREGVDDEIVSGVIEVLQNTRNRPHTVRELAAVLSGSINIVENSANPHAIISSRLNSYLKRGFPASSPCLLAKELITTHPRRIYFYLTTSPHQPIPAHETPIAVPHRRSVISPDLSDDEEDRRRIEMSPSPEVDLSSHELEDEDKLSSPDHSCLSTSAGIIARDRTDSPSSLGRKSALSSPPLEGDEREFSQSAIYIERRSASREYEQRQQQAAKEEDAHSGEKRSRDEFETDVNEDKSIEARSNEAAEMILGYGASANVSDLINPIVGPSHIQPITPRKRQSSVDIDDVDRHRDHEKSSEDTEVGVGLGLGNWGGELERHLGSPESVELDELDNLLDF
ncbi:hypothetical protein RUND412_007168 [Rhizina undulata]